MNWSSGKDSALTLHRLIESGNAPELLLTTIGKEEQRIGMHGLRRELLEAQAESIGIPLKIIELSSSTDHEAYNKLMYHTCKELKEQGFDTAVYGDIFLADLRAYRETQLKEVGIQAEFPLWQNDTTKLINEFVNAGLRSMIVSAAEKHFKKDFLGTLIDEDFVTKLPQSVDPCGENGEFHSFCFDGPIFAKAIDFTKGELVLRHYDDPKQGESSDSQSTDFKKARKQKNETNENEQDSRTQSTASDSKLGFYFLDLLPKQ